MARWWPQDRADGRQWAPILFRQRGCAVKAATCVEVRCRGEIVCRLQIGEFRNHCGPPPATRRRVESILGCGSVHGRMTSGRLRRKQCQRLCCSATKPTSCVTKVLYASAVVWLSG